MQIAIIGGGAAGFFCAINIKELMPTADVTIYEANSKLLTKVGISGGGRCNLSNTFAEVKNLKQVYPRGEKLIKRSFKTFNQNDVYKWFENHGVELKIENGTHVYPKSDNALEIVNTLIGLAKNLGIKIKTLCPINSIIKDNDTFRLSSDIGEHHSNIVVVTTGGSSKIEKYSFLNNLPIEIKKPIASLFTFRIADKGLTQLMGTVVKDAKISIRGEKLSAEGDILITHWGFSGPATLKLSSYAAKFLDSKNNNCRIAVNWTGIVNEEIVREQMSEVLSTEGKKLISNIKIFNFTTKFWHYILQRANIELDRICNDIKSKSLNILIQTLCNDEYLVIGTARHKEEFVTCGGVSLNSIDLNTLQAKNCDGLYFAGEVLDVDGVTGGFNLLAAWSTGYCVSVSIANKTTD